MRFMKFARGGVQKLARIVAITLSACLMIDIAPVQAASGTVTDYYFGDYEFNPTTGGIKHFVVFMNVSGFSDAPTVYERSEAEALGGTDWWSTKAISGSWMRANRQFSYAAIFDLGNASMGHGKYGLVHVHIYDSGTLVKWIDTSLYIRHVFDANGGTPAKVTAETTPGGIVQEPVVTRTGYSFLSWSDTCSTVADTSNSNPNTYSHRASWEHWVFSGWNTKPDGSGTIYAPGEALPNRNLDLYAQWRREVVR